MVFMEIHVGKQLWRCLLWNLNYWQACQDGRLDVQNLWADLSVTLPAKYSVCCTQSALIHVGRNPRAKNLARCEGLQLMCVSSSVAELQKSGIVCELQQLSKLKWWKRWLGSICCCVRLYAFNWKLFMDQAELRWYQGCSKPSGCGWFGHSFMVMD